MRLADSDRRSQIRRLHKNRIPELALYQFLNFLRLFLPGAAENRYVFHDGNSRRNKQRLHNVFVHARGRAQHARADISNVRQFEQPLNGSILAERAMQNRKDDIDVDGTVAGAPREPGIGLKRNEATLPMRTGSGGTTTASPRASTAAGCVVSGSPARKWRGSITSLPCNRFSASPPSDQRPSLVMPMGTTSYLSLSIACRTDAAESSETSCSPLRPPKRTPTRSLFIIFYKIFFPNADSANSTARSAVRLCSSITGFTSTISKLSIRP